MSQPGATTLETRNRSTFRIAGITVFSLCMVWSTFIAANAWHDVRKRPDKNNLRVTGSAKKRIISDLIEWTSVIDARHNDRTEAYRMVREGREKAVKFLVDQGIKPEEIKPQSAALEELFETVDETQVLPGTNVPVRSQKRVFKGFSARESILVSSNDVPRVEKASREITSLLEQGVSVTSLPPDYHYTQLGELKLEMLAAAAKDARSRAENILGSAGNTTLGKLVSADMGIININPANSTATSAEGNNDKSSYEKDIITIIRAEYEVN